MSGARGAPTSPDAPLDAAPDAPPDAPLDGTLGPRFDGSVPAGGYRWWYIDALSDDGRHGLTVIAFVGSVFSPYYAWAGHAEPEDHVCINVALYGPRHHWAMTERGRDALERDATHFRVGPSRLSWDGTRLTLEIDERSTPFPRPQRGYPMRGRITLEAETLATARMAIDHAGLHRWQPLAPAARVEVAMDTPDVRWSGHGYLDTNDGDEMLEQGFRRWDWSRARMADGTTAILYDCTEHDDTGRTLALHIDHDGSVAAFEPPPLQRLPRGWWGVSRATRADGEARIAHAFEDAPFYTRAAIDTVLRGERVTAVHETFDGKRFANGVIKWMLTMRMPRRTGLR
ncbi:MAG: carotenoid 1,2-hydratase [Pseudomonadota bacterium]